MIADRNGPIEILLPINLCPSQLYVALVRVIDFYHLQRAEFPWGCLPNQTSHSNKRRKPAIAIKSSSLVKSTFVSFFFASFLIKIRTITVVTVYRLLSFVKRFLTRALGSLCLPIRYSGLIVANTRETVAMSAVVFTVVQCRLHHPNS